MTSRKRLLAFTFVLLIVTGVAGGQDAGAGSIGTTTTGVTLGDLEAPGEQALRIPFVNLEIREPENNSEVALSLQLLLLLAVLSLAPSLIIIMTSFLRIAIVFDFIKRALSLQQVPPESSSHGHRAVPDLVHHVAHRHCHL